MLRPRQYFDNNVTRTFGLFEALLDSSVKHVIFSSTCSIYGIPRHAPITEAHPRNPVNPYGESKLMIEKALGWYAAAYGLSSMCLRYFNAAGCDPDGEIGESHDPETHLIPLVIQAASGVRDAIQVFGTDYPTLDGTAVRDYTHVADLADAHVLALRYLLNGGESQSLNLGLGRGHSVLEVIEAVEDVAGRRVPARLGARRLGDPAVLVADPSKAGKILGWRPRFTDLTKMVSTAWDWHCAEESPDAVRAARV